MAVNKRRIPDADSESSDWGSISDEEEELQHVDPRSLTSSVQKELESADACLKSKKGMTTVLHRRYKMTRPPSFSETDEKSTGDATAEKQSKVSQKIKRLAKGAVAKKQTDVDRLQVDVDRCKQELEYVSAENIQLKHEMQSKKQLLQNSVAETATLTRVLQEYKKMNCQLEKNLLEANVRLKDLSERRAADLPAKLNSLQAANVRVIEISQRKEKELSEEIQSLKEANSELSDLSVHKANQLSEEIMSLKKSKAALQVMSDQKNIELSEEINSIRDKLADTTSQLQTTELLCKDLATAVKEKSELLGHHEQAAAIKIKALKEKLANADITLAVQQSKVEQLQATLENTQKERDKKRSLKDRFFDKKKSECAACVDFTAINNLLKSELQSKHIIIEDSAKKLSELNQENTLKSDKIHELQENLSKLQAEFDNQEAKMIEVMDATEKALAEKVTDILEIQQKYVQERSAVATITQKLTDKETEIIAKDMQIKKLRETMAEVTNKLEAVQKRKEESESAAEQHLEKLNAEHNTHIVDLQKQLSTAQNKYNSLEYDFQSAKRHFEEKTELLQTRLDENTNMLMQQNEALDTRTAQFTLENEQWSKRVTQCEVDIDNKNARIEKLSSDNLKLDTKFEQCNQLNEKLNKQLTYLSAENKNQSDNNNIVQEKLNIKIQQLLANKCDLQKEIETVKTHNMTLQNELEILSNDKQQNTDSCTDQNIILQHDLNKAVLENNALKSEIPNVKATCKELRKLNTSPWSIKGNEYGDGNDIEFVNEQTALQKTITINEKGQLKSINQSETITQLQEEIKILKAQQQMQVQSGIELEMLKIVTIFKTKDEEQFGTIDSLHKEIKHGIEMLQNELESKTNYAKQLEKTLNENQLEMNGERLERNSIQDQNEMLMKTIKQGTDQMQRRMLQLDQQLLHKQETITALKEELKELKRAAEDKNKLIFQKDERLQEERATTKRLIDTVEKSQNTVNQLLMELRHLQELLANNEVPPAVDSTYGEVHKPLHDTLGLNVKLKELMKENEQLASTNSKLQREEISRASQQQTIEDLNDKINAAKKAEERYKREIRNLAESLEDCENVRSSQQSEMDKLSSRAAQETNRWKEKAQDCDTKLAAQEEKLQKQHHQLLHWNEQHRDCTIKIEKYELEIKEANEHSDTLTKRLTETEMRTQHLMNELLIIRTDHCGERKFSNNEADHDNVILKRKLNTLEEEIDSVLQQLKPLMLENSTERDTYEYLTNIHKYLYTRSHEEHMELVLIGQSVKHEHIDTQKNKIENIKLPAEQEYTDDCGCFKQDNSHNTAKLDSFIKQTAKLKESLKSLEDIMRHYKKQMELDQKTFDSRAKHFEQLMRDMECIDEQPDIGQSTVNSDIHLQLYNNHEEAKNNDSLTDDQLLKKDIRNKDLQIKILKCRLDHCFEELEYQREKHDTQRVAEFAKIESNILRQNDELTEQLLALYMDLWQKNEELEITKFELSTYKTPLSNADIQRPIMNHEVKYRVPFCDDINKYTVKISELHSEVQELHKQHSMMDEKLKQSETEKMALLTNLNECEEELTRLQSGQVMLANKEEQILALREDMHVIQNELTDQQSKLHYKDICNKEEVSKLNATIAKLNDKIHKQSKQIETLRVDNFNHQALLDEHTGKQKSKWTSVGEISKLIARENQTPIADKDNEILSLKETHTVLNNEIKSLQERIKKYDKELETTRKTLAKYEHLDTISNIVEENERLSSCLQSKETECIILKGKVAILEKKFQKIREKYRILKERYTHAHDTTAYSNPDLSQSSSSKLSYTENNVNHESQLSLHDISLSKSTKVQFQISKSNSSKSKSMPDSITNNPNNPFL